MGFSFLLLLLQSQLHDFNCDFLNMAIFFKKKKLTKKNNASFDAEDDDNNNNNSSRQNICYGQQFSRQFSHYLCDWTLVPLLVKARTIPMLLLAKRVPKTVCKITLIQKEIVYIVAKQNIMNIIMLSRNICRGSYFHTYHCFCKVPFTYV